jgi:hypothetical protein
VGQWRATYTSGDWIVLSGPTSLVLLEPPAPEWSDLVNTIWDAVVESSSLPDLAGRLAAYGIDRLPSFAAFFWTAEGMRSLVRGDVAVVDLASGDVVARGEGIQTWSEIGLDGVRQVRIETPQSAAEESQFALPLVVGAAGVSSVTLDATDEARVISPQGQSTPAADGLAVTEALPEMAPEPTMAMSAPEDDVHWAFWDDVPTPLQPIDLDQSASELLEDEATSRVPDRPRTPMPSGYDAEALARLENADTALMVTPPPPTPASMAAASPSSPPVAELSQDSLIMAVVCQDGHASPQNATTCRICGSPIAPQGPRLIPRPVLAVLRAPDGTTAVVDRAVLVGRAPSSHLSSARAPRLMTVPSPGHDISRTHLEVAPEGWQITVTDLNSTNGTVLVRPDGADRQQLKAGEPVLVQLGTVVELGDGISVLIDFPQ